MKRIINTRLTLIMAAALVFLAVLAIPVRAGTYKDFEYTYDSSTQEVRITKYTGNSAEVVIPARINGYYVTKIDYKAFCENTTLVRVSFEAGSRLREIDWYCFEGCTSLERIVLPDTVREIGDDCFMYCSRLTSISIPEGVTELGSSNFAGMFYGCTALKEVKLPSTLTYLGQGCFRDCVSLQQISIPDSVTGAGCNAFMGSGLTSVTLPEGMSSVRYYMFADCKALKTVNLSSNVTTFENSAFKGCTSLVSLKVPADLTGIESECFRGCTALEELKFGDAVTYLSGDYIFADCPKLTVYVVRGTEPEEYCMNHNVQYQAYASSLGGCEVEGIVDKIYNGSAQTQNLKVTYHSDSLELNTDYTVSYSNNINAGTATLELNGIGNYIGKVTKTFKIGAADMNDCKLKLSRTSLVYQAKYLKPSVTVTFHGKKVSGSDYDVYYSNHQYVGTAEVTVSGKGNFINSKKTSFTIVPKATKIKSVKAQSRGFQAAWKQNKIQTSGYQLQYSLKKNFKSSKKVDIPYWNVTKQAVKKLKGGKTYYVRIRCYRTVGGKNYYSAWSKAATVKTKK